MIPSVSPSSKSPYTPAPTGAVVLQAQIGRYEQQLSDCVNCASATTTKGKSDIAAISAKIDNLKAQISESAGPKLQASDETDGGATSTPGTRSAPAPSPVRTTASTDIADSRDSTIPTEPVTYLSKTTPVGTRLDVFA
ncbi:MAG: hypothetical protein NVSMB6_16070 [Burkholderiaceae bacterium]